MKTVLVTGANGFIGSALLRELSDNGYLLKGAVRSKSPCLQRSNFEQVAAPDISSCSQWLSLLQGVDVIVHLAARVHVMEETEQNPDALFKKVNLEGTKNLALQATEAGVKRFIYISTIKVNGERAESVLHSGMDAVPQDPYAVSKWQAECTLLDIAEKTGLEVVIIRPPLVYGPGVKGNFLRLLKLVQKNLPIPLGDVINKRSMVYVANLCNLIKTCIHHPNAAGRMFLVSDNHDISTPDLIRLIAKELNHQEKLWSIPVSWLYAAARVFGKEAEVDRLCGSLQVDIEETMQLLSWRPPYTVQQGVQATAQWFKFHHGRELS